MTRLRRLCAASRPPTVSLAVAPDAVEVRPHELRIGEGWVRSFCVTGYPREVGLGWLEPLLTHPGTVDVSLHIEPVPAEVAAMRLRTQRARLESTLRIDEERGRLVDPEVEAAVDDAGDLARRVARGEGRLFRAGLFLTVWACSQAELDAESGRVRALAASLLVDLRPASFRSLQGWLTTAPLGLDLLRVRRTLDTAALAAAYPFASAELPTQAGVLYGRTVRGRGLVHWDRFAQDNYNAVILGASGTGKSYLQKLEALRWMYRGVEVAVIDPEDEWPRLAAAVGGTHLRLGCSGVRLNPFDLDLAGAGDDGVDPIDPLIRRALFLHTLVTVLLGGEPLSATARAALDRGIVATYAGGGITCDPHTHTRPAPVLADLARSLDDDRDPVANELAARLAPHVSGTHRALFDGPTTARMQGHLVVFGLRSLPEELRPAGMLLTLDAVWRRVTDPIHRRRRLVVVDEADVVMRDPAGADFLHRLARRARKHWCGLTVATQQADDLLGSALGRAVVHNAATQILLGQAPEAIEEVAAAFRLSEGEKAFLVAGGCTGSGAHRPRARGDAILSAGGDRVAFRALASPAEHRLITTDPAELAEMDETRAPDAEGWPADVTGRRRGPQRRHQVA
jgi:type IV secretory pathway VirB4 component